MAFCGHCGAALGEGARFCGQCGTPSLGPAGAPPPPFAPPPGSAPPRPKPDTHLAELLLLAGAVLSLVFPILFAATFATIGAALVAAIPGWGSIPGAVFGLLSIVVFVLGAIWAAAAWYARGRIQRGDLEGGGMVAMVVGVLMFFTGHFIAGPLVAIGGVMAWSQK